MESEDGYTHIIGHNTENNIQKKEWCQKTDIRSILGHNTEDNIQKETGIGRQIKAQLRI